MSVVAAAVFMGVLWHACLQPHIAVELHQMTLSGPTSGCGPGARAKCTMTLPRRGADLRLHFSYRDPGSRELNRESVRIFFPKNRVNG